jgi:hypothetical protein
LVLNRFPTALGDATLRLSPLVVAKMVLVIDSFYRYPHTQITEVLLPLVMARGVVLRKRSAVVDYWVVLQKKLKVRKPLGKEVDYATTPKIWCMH